MTGSPLARFSAETHIGLVRKLNEDALIARPEIGLWVVADGMGGHEAGDVASKCIVDRLAALPVGGDGAAVMRSSREAIMAAHAELLVEAARRGGTIGSTVVALIISDGFFACLWAGDSRLYLLRGGDLQMITSDHSLVAPLVESGQMTWAEAEKHPQANVITRAIGATEVLELDKRHGPLEAGDRFLLCSDGLTRYVDEQAMASIVASNAVEDVAGALIELALEGGGGDNVTVIAVDAITASEGPALSYAEADTVPPGGAAPGKAVHGRDVVDEIIGEDPL